MYCKRSKRKDMKMYCKQGKWTDLKMYCKRGKLKEIHFVAMFSKENENLKLTTNVVFIPRKSIMILTRVNCNIACMNDESSFINL